MCHTCPRLICRTMSQFITMRQRSLHSRMLIVCFLEACNPSHLQHARRGALSLRHVTPPSFCPMYLGRAAAVPRTLPSHPISRSFIVYRARCMYSGGVVVLKGYSRESLTLQTRQRVFSEVSLLQRAQCPFILKCFDSFEDQVIGGIQAPGRVHVETVTTTTTQSRSVLISLGTR